MGENEYSTGGPVATLRYYVTALQMPIYFNAHGDHDHNGLIYALSANVPILKYIRALSGAGLPRAPHGAHNEEETPEKLYQDAKARADEIEAALPATPAEARKPHPLVRPLVLRARLGEEVEVHLCNEIRGRCVGIHLVADGYDVKASDGSQVGRNEPSLALSGNCRGDEPPGHLPYIYRWSCGHEGVFPFHDGGNYSGGEDGTNVHGLFGALIVEPEGANWRDPVTARKAFDADGNFQELDGLYLDVIPGPAQGRPEDEASTTTLENHDWGCPEEYPEFDEAAHREFVIFFHDEPEYLPPHVQHEANPCGDVGAVHDGEAQGGGHGGHGEDLLPIMPISYRAEPMISRERILWRMIRERQLDPARPVLNEEQHHSSWLFGDPATPILKAYIGDPVRIRLVHAAVKETHVFHLHVYEWHAVPGDRDSPRIDAISISPQTAHTIEPLWGAGNRQQIAGDVIWHCHLYPHFHEGMWGIFRTFETRQDGEAGGEIHHDAAVDPFYAQRYAGRRLGEYPDGTRIEKLLPLPGRTPPPRPTPKRPGYPLYIPGEVRQKSPLPPWPDREAMEGDELPSGVESLRAASMPPDFDYRPTPSYLERRAFNEQPVPGELFTRNRFGKQQAKEWEQNPMLEWNEARTVNFDVAVALDEIVYNSHGWTDPHGHFYELLATTQLDELPEPAEPREPLYVRANHGQIINSTFLNALPEAIPGTAFDPPFPPCDALPWEGECAMHVHMVKFDPVCADGASVGWNYISGPRFGKKMIYRWWADQEFGTIFFHDHLFANFRQKHGLWAALLVEPAGAKYFDNFSGEEIITGAQAVIVHPPAESSDGALTEKFREFCIGIGDFIPAFDRQGDPLNPPPSPGGHGDQGIMGLNYRSAPIRERPGDPAFWFSSHQHCDPDTTRFEAREEDPIWIRLVQGSHEEQHSFQIHGMRWRRFRVRQDSNVRNQQTLGLAEAFTFIITDESHPWGDYLYKLSGADDLWLGCWGILRIRPLDEEGGPMPLEQLGDEAPIAEPSVANGGSRTPPVRHFHVIAEQRRLVYREPDLIDPFALVYRLVSWQGPEDAEPHGIEPGDWPGPFEPLVLRCREGETVRVTLENGLPEDVELVPEPFAPEVPVEKRDRPVSSHVSMHADLVRYEVRESDGATVGLNPLQSAPPGGTVEYFWDTTTPTGAENQETLGAVLLQDMADFRNHRHHGLIGALVIEPADATPRRVPIGEPTATEHDPEAWYGSRATIFREHGGEAETDYLPREEIVLLLQDGLRLFLHGNVNFPIPDALADPEEEAEDQGQKAFNYRSEPVGPVPGEEGCERWLSLPGAEPGATRDPATPVWLVPQGSRVCLHLVGACDKPRNHSFTIHGVAWPEWRYLSDESPTVASESAISCGTVRAFEFTPAYEGDHAYRSGVLKWAVMQGLWGILRVAKQSHDL